MTPFDLVAFAFTAVTRHRRRSLFSILGMTVGVAAVVLLTALGDGARRYITREFSSLGSNLLIVFPGKNETIGGFPGMGGVPNDLTLDDALALERGVPGAELAVPIVLGSETVSYLERQRQVMVLGTTHAFLEARELTMAAGSFLPASEMDRGAPVAVVGATVAEELFPGENPLGRRMRIGDWRMRIIGVMESEGHQIGINIDDMAFIPVASAMRLFNRDSLFRVLLKLEAGADVEASRLRTLEIIAERHDEEDVTCITQDSVVESLSKIMNALTLALAGIAAISLSVAGLGVMNLMLVSVSDRTSEVGLLVAVGAQRRQIQALFLTEAVLLATTGALAGLTLGYAGVRVFVAFYPNFPASPPLWAVVAVVVVAVAVGAIFGVLPARKASGLDPVAALAGR